MWLVALICHSTWHSDLSLPAQLNSWHFLKNVFFPFLSSSPYGTPITPKLECLILSLDVWGFYLITLFFRLDNFCCLSSGLLYFSSTTLNLLKTIQWIFQFNYWTFQFNYYTIFNGFHSLWRDYISFHWLNYFSLWFGHISFVFLKNIFVIAYLINCIYRRPLSWFLLSAFFLDYLLHFILECVPSNFYCVLDVVGESIWRLDFVIFLY